MNVDWQQSVALALAAIAAGYIGWRAWRRYLGKGGCPACSACGSNKTKGTVQGKAIVPIDSLIDSTPAKHDGGAR